MCTMERFSAKQLVEYLAKVAVDLDDEVLDVIRKAKVTGKRALKYDISAWSNIGLAYGDILEVMDCINNFSSFSQNTDKENSPPLSQASVEPMKSGPSTSFLTIHSQPTTTEPESNSENRRKRPHPITYSSDSDEEIVNLKKFECLKQYFSPEEFSDLSLSVKQSYLEEKDNYEFGLKQNVNIDRPSFMVPKKSSQKESKLMITPSTSTAQTIREHSQIKSLTAPTTSQSSLATNDKNSPKPSVSRKPASDKQARDSTLDSNETSDDESDDDSQNQNKSAKSSETSSVATSKKPRKKRQRLIDTLSNEEVANKLPKYDIEAILSGKGEKEKDVLEVLKSDGIVYEAQRKLMMRTLTKYIYFDEKG
ncbi:RNA 3'-terminal phosphate cyclase [Frankliniella fusca]|nr:RNA 3'-terminal phosphate cyclase [Frankliniella fusca]